jgi:hypothetical protein
MFMKKNTLSLLLCIMLFLCGCDNNADQDIDQFTLSERCDLAPVAGPCEALIYKYYYDKTEKKCKEFLWGGCDGVVPFETMEECQQCVTKSPKKN